MDRSTLKFNIYVKQYFGFLLKEFGFVIEKEETTLVVFKRDKMIISIYHGRQSYEIGMEVTFAGGNMATLFEILNIIAPDDSKKVIKQASNIKAVEMSLAEISSIFEVKCRKLLEKKIDENELAKEIAVNRKKYTLEYQYGALKDKAEVAWRNKEYSKVKEIYLSIYEHLDENEKRRLKYLQKKRLND